MVVPAGLTRELREIGKQNSVTLFMTLLAAFQIALSRCARQSDIAVGSPIANRRRPELEALIGFFVNTLVLRTNRAVIRGFRNCCQCETALGAYGNQGLPFEQLVEELQPDRACRQSAGTGRFVQNATPAHWRVRPDSEPVNEHRGPCVGLNVPARREAWRAFAFDAIFEEFTIRRLRQYRLC